MTTLIMTADKIGLPGVANWFKKLYANIQHARQVKSTMQQLSALSDRELQDMGIGRGDIHAIAHGDESFKRSVETNKNLGGWV